MGAPAYNVWHSVSSTGCGTQFCCPLCSHWTEVELVSVWTRHCAGAGVFNKADCSQRCFTTDFTPRFLITDVQSCLQPCANERITPVIMPAVFAASYVMWPWLVVQRNSVGEEDEKEEKHNWPIWWLKLKGNRRKKKECLGLESWSGKTKKWKQAQNEMSKLCTCVTSVYELGSTLLLHSSPNKLSQKEVACSE